MRVMLALAWVLSIAPSACKRPESVPSDARSGGSATVFDVTRDAFGQPSAWLSDAHRRTFFVGNSFFNLSWLAAPASVADRDGLGPLFNARSCSGCHFKDGRGRPPEPESPPVSMLLRISVPGRGPHGAPLAEPTYGDQIQGSALPGLPAEANVVVTYEERPGMFADGERYSLRKPRYRLEQLGYGAPAEPLLTSPRVAPALVGLGLLESVPDAALAALADPGDKNGDGISGRQNQVPDAKTGTLVPGRFGWKAEQPSVIQQCAGALLGDMGLTSRLFATQNHSGRESACNDAPNGGAPEVSDAILDALGLYARSLAVPARRSVEQPAVKRGEALFDKIGCTRCHAPTLRTGPLAALPELPAEDIHPYTDLLLHDLGPDLSDERPVFTAEGAEWRTPPLWGLGLVKQVNGHTFLLHDGRARNASEAVLWHGGEALGARKAFTVLERQDRDALVAFLGSL
ncbi:MAG TPA: di-heme oxidoredictase family protein [Polyangiaceae bacterium]|nr:di-heme oxidoredictase family protein [Polyangiaceae bacterium]